jgi:hypothetical protein
MITPPSCCWFSLIVAQWSRCPQNGHIVFDPLLWVSGFRFFVTLFKLSLESSSVYMVFLQWSVCRNVKPLCQHCLWPCLLRVSAHVLQICLTQLTLSKIICFEVFTASCSSDGLMVSYTVQDVSSTCDSCWLQWMLKWFGGEDVLIVYEGCKYFGQCKLLKAKSG